MRKLVDQALDEEKPSFQAAKYLADKEWIPKAQKKQETAKERNQRKQINAQHAKNFERVANLVNK